MTFTDDDRLAAVLTSIGDDLVTVAPTPARRSNPHVRIGAVAAALTVAIVVVVIAVAPVREAVARWLGIGSTQIEVDPNASVTAASLPTIDAAADPVSASDAATLVSELPDLDGTSLGPPTGFARMPEGGVLAAWPDGTTLWIRDVTADTEVPFTKVVATMEDVTMVDGLGDEALAIDAEHFLRTPHRLVASTAVVLWRSGAVEFRLEADRDRAELIELARAIDSGG